MLYTYEEKDDFINLALIFGILVRTGVLTVCINKNNTQREVLSTVEKRRCFNNYKAGYIWKSSKVGKPLQH